MPSRREGVRECASLLMKAALSLLRVAAEAYHATLLGSDEEVEAAWQNLMFVREEVLR